jgi:hypothetical protein
MLLGRYFTIIHFYRYIIFVGNIESNTLYSSELPYVLDKGYVERS